MKFRQYFNPYSQLIFILLLILFTTKTTSNKVFSLEMETICSKADNYINSFFNEYKELDENTKNFCPNEPLTENDDEILKMLFFDEDAINSYTKKKFNFLKICNIIFFVLLVLFVFIIIIFELHFMAKLCFQNEDENYSKINFLILTSISPLCLFKYFCLSEKKAKEYYEKYQNQKLFKLNKIYYLFFLIILLGLFVTILILSVYNTIHIPKGKNALNNMSCIFSKFIYELNNTPLRNSEFIGLNKIDDFLNILNENSNNLDNYLKNFNETYNEVLKNYLKKWNTLLNQIDNNLSDQNSMEFFIETFPSEPICEEADCSNYEKHKYQLKLLFDYYPHTENDKILYKADTKLQEFYSTISQVIENINIDFISKKNQNISFDKNSLFYKIIIKAKPIFDFYLSEFSSIYFEKVNNLFNNVLSFLTITNYIYLILLVIIIGLSIAFIQYIFLQSCMRNKFILIIILFNSIFIILILSIFISFKILKIKEKIIYIKDITKGIYFIFDKNNINYFKGRSYKKINNIDIDIYENNTEINQLFYYLNNIINNNGNISNIYPINEFNSSLQNILDTSNKIYTLYNQKSIFNYSLLNDDTNKYSENINNFLTNGLQYNTNFRDINKTGYRETANETPITYLINISIRTRKERREVFEFGNIICDESWNISTFDYYWFKYMPREKVLCDGCINTCTNQKYLLNYLEYSFDEILERYKSLNESNDKNSIKIYNVIIFEFTALEEMRSNKIFEQVKKLKEINSELIDLENDLYNELKNSLNIANDIINLCKNIFSDYSNKNSTKLYSFLDCDFIRNDLNFILYEVENNCLPELNILYKNYIILNIISVLFSFIFLIFYLMTSYQPIKNEIEENLKKKLKDEIDKKFAYKNANKNDLIGNLNTQKNHVYNTIVFQNSQKKFFKNQTSFLDLIDNEQKSIKNNCIIYNANLKN